MHLARAYRRWRRRRLGLLVPALLAVALLMAHLAAVDDLRPSARLALLAAASLAAAVCLAAAALTLACDRLHRRGRRAEGRFLRHLLEPAERLVAPAVLLLLPVALAPGVFRNPPREARPVLVVLPPPMNASGSPVGVPPPPPEEGPAEPPPTPAIQEPEAAAPEPPAPAAASAGPAVAGGEADNDAFRLRMEDLQAPLAWTALTLELHRLGVPDDDRPLEGRPFAVELDVMVLWEDDAAQGSGMSVRFDLPTSGGPVLRLSTLYLSLSGEDELLEGEPEFALSHTTLDAVFRLAGGTRRATLDLFLSAGLAVDVADAGAMDADARLSPHLAVDLALWQSSRLGFQFHAGQTIPTSVTGGSAAVTELAASVRIDLSERISLRAGWRHLVVHLRDYDGAFATGALAELDRDFSGPFAGLEVRF